jgi:hypothetical protein
MTLARVRFAAEGVGVRHAGENPCSPLLTRLHGKLIALVGERDLALGAKIVAA